MKKIVRLKDIARESGYSIKTVSRAINNHPDIKESTKNKILEISKKYSYNPNMLAKSLRTKKTYTIGYIIPDLKNEFFARVGIVLEDKLRKYGYNILVSFTKGKGENEIESLKILLSKRVDGIVLATVGTTGDYLRKLIHDYRIPIVVIDNKIDVDGLYFVLHNNIEGAYLLTEHLIKHGHKEIACITGPVNETSSIERLDGYKKALNDYGIDVKEELIKISNWEEKGGFYAASELLNNKENKPTGIFTANSIMAIGVYKIIKKMGLNIPDDLALVSFDNFDFVDILDPPLTTLGGVEDNIGKKAVEILLGEINNELDFKLENKEFSFKSKLCIRRSCGCN